MPKFMPDPCVPVAMIPPIVMSSMAGRLKNNITYDKKLALGEPKMGSNEKYKKNNNN